MQWNPSAPRSRQITTSTPHYLIFLQTGCSSWRPTNSVKVLKINLYNCRKEYTLLLKEISPEYRYSKKYRRKRCGGLLNLRQSSFELDGVANEPLRVAVSGVEQPGNGRHVVLVRLDPRVGLVVAVVVAAAEAQTRRVQRNNLPSTHTKMSRS